ncbi:RND transporter [Nocardioides sp. SYSU DS0651]|uniref:RND transporter n=1 Tax=Nocardioides sp. SYSU DS0651 TaxID=3415955 RepID=UPI003F4BE131
MERRTRERAGGILALILVAVAIVGGLAQVRIDTGIGSFVPHGDDSYDQLTQRDEQFGADPVVVLLKGRARNGLVLDQEQLQKLVALEGRLSAIKDVAVVYGPGTVLNQSAIAIRNVLLQVSGRRDALANAAQQTARDRGLTRSQTTSFVEKQLARFDRRYGALFVQALPMGLPSLRNQQFVAASLLGPDGEPRPEWRFLLPTARSATILVRPRDHLDQAATDAVVAEVRRTVGDAGLDVDPPVITGVPVLTSAVADRATTEAPLLGGIAVAVVAGIFFLVPWSRRRRDRLRPLLAAVLGTATTLAVMGWLDRPLSLGVVAFLPIVLGIGSDFPLYLSQPARRRRVLAAAAGAMFAFAALAISPLPFVREFGLAIACAVALTFAWAVVLRSKLPEVEPVEPRPAPRVPRDAARRLAAIAVLPAVVGWVLLPGLSLESRPEQLAKGLPELADVDRAEEALGFSTEISVVVRGENVLTPEVLAWSQKVEDRIVAAHGDRVRPVLTVPRLLKFLGESATPTQVVAGSELLPPYLVSAVIGGGGDVAVSTYGLDIDDVAAQQRLIEDIREDLPAPPEGFDVTVVGLPVVAAGGLEAMSTGRFVITAVSVAVAAVAVGFLLGDRRLAAMVAAVSALASGWLYLGLHLAGAELNPLTLAAGALVTVVACEFTVMLGGAGRQRWLGRSVLLAATAGTAGYLCLAWSELAVLRSFGLLLAAGVAATYVAAQLVVAATGRDESHLPDVERDSEDGPDDERDEGVDGGADDEVEEDAAETRRRLTIGKDAGPAKGRSPVLALEES